MAKFKTTKKFMKENYRCFSVGYCDLQTLLAFTDPVAYTCGVYGWNANVYTFGGVAIVTGYRPFGEYVDYEKIRNYEKAADAIRHDNGKPYGEREAAINALLKQFITELISG